MVSCEAFGPRGVALRRRILGPGRRILRSGRRILRSDAEYCVPDVEYCDPDVEFGLPNIENSLFCPRAQPYLVKEQQLIAFWVKFPNP